MDYVIYENGEVTGTTRHPHLYEGDNSFTLIPFDDYIKRYEPINPQWAPPPGFNSSVTPELPTMNYSSGQSPKPRRHALKQPTEHLLYKQQQLKNQLPPPEVE